MRWTPWRPHQAAPRCLALVALVAVAWVVPTAAGCGPSISPVAVLEPVDVVTGWFDDGLVAGGKNKLVPSITLKFRNKSSAPIASVQVNAIFRRVGEQEMWGEHFGWAVAKQPLGPGADTDLLVMRSALGYTGEEPRMQILQNSQFVDAKVDIFLRKGSSVWAKLAEYPIQRQLITR